MKKYLIIHLISLLLLLIITRSLQAQRHYQEGYIVLTRGDTLYGKIKDRKPEPFGKIYERIRFRDGGLFPKKYGPGELLAYQAGVRTYESLWLSTPFPILDARLISVAGRGQKQFMRVLQKGKLSYYSLETDQDDTGFYSDIPYLKREDKREFVRATQGIFGLKRKLLAEYFEDCQPLREAIEDKQLSSVFEIVDFYYNNCQVNQYYNPDYQKQ